MTNLRNTRFEVLLTFKMIKENIDYLKWALEYLTFCVDSIVGSENNAGVVCNGKQTVLSCTLYSLLEQVIIFGKY